MPTEYYPVVSSAIASLAYDDEAEEGYITFKDGRSYILEGIPEMEIYRMANATSPGAYWNLYLRGRY